MSRISILHQRGGRGEIDWFSDNSEMEISRVIRNLI